MSCSPLTRSRKGLRSKLHPAAQAPAADTSSQSHTSHGHQSHTSHGRKKKESLESQPIVVPFVAYWRQGHFGESR